MTVRGAVPEDAAAIASVLYQSFAEFRPHYTSRGFAATAIGTEEVINRLTEGPVWVALWEDSICGTVAALARDEALYLRGMAVVPGTRGKGAGEALLKQVEAFATQHGHQRLLLTTTPFLVSAIRLYEKFGFYRISGSSADLFGTPLFTMEKKLQAPNESWR
jgi:GNAT superfamily N-acetyltransferase